MTIQEMKDRGLLIFEGIIGSQAYGTSTPTSDIDMKGVYIQPIEDIMGMNYIEQISDEKSDKVYYELRRFLELIATNNPNIIELLNLPEELITYKHPIYDLILENNDKFISKICRNSFAGYAIAQISKARGLNKKIVNPVDKERKNPLDFAYVHFGYNSIPLKKYLKDNNLNQKFCGIANVPHAQDLYGMFYDFNAHNRFASIPDHNKLRYEKLERILGEEFPHKYLWYDGRINSRDFNPGEWRAFKNECLEGGQFLNYKGIVKESEDGSFPSNELRMSHIEKEERNNMLCYFTYNKDGYTQYCKDYKEYHEWVEKRNQARYNDNTKHGKGYDCYLDSETEFLTEKGWLKYSNITTEKLATIDKNKNIIYQNYTNRFDDFYTGDFYTYENRYTRFSVTPNHKLYVSNAHRTMSNNFSTKYDNNNSKWYLESVNDYFNDRRSHKHILSSCNNSSSDFNISDDTIKILGAYLSDGTMLFDNNKPKGIRISQLENKPLTKLMKSITEYKVCENFSKETKGGKNYVYDIHCVKFSKFIYDNFGHGSFNKKLPDFIYKFSKRQVNILLESMVDGDGHKHIKGHTIYYSSNKKMIEDLQLLLFMNNRASQIYEYYSKSGYEETETLKYQLFIPKTDKQYICMSKNKKNWNKYYVENEKIVCFTVPNSILITRNNNKISIQGNSKNMMHCHRLLDMAIEIGEGKGVIVRRPNREYLMSIRSGEMDYDFLVADAERKIKLIDKLFDESTLPEKINMKFVNDLLIKIRKEFYK